MSFSTRCFLFLFLFSLHTYQTSYAEDVESPSSVLESTQFRIDRDVIINQDPCIIGELNEYVFYDENDPAQLHWQPGDSDPTALPKPASDEDSQDSTDELASAAAFISNKQDDDDDDDDQLEDDIEAETTDEDDEMDDNAKRRRKRRQRRRIRKQNRRKQMQERERAKRLSQQQVLAYWKSEFDAWFKAWTTFFLKSFLQTHYASLEQGKSSTKACFIANFEKRHQCCIEMAEVPREVFFNDEHYKLPRGFTSVVFGRKFRKWIKNKMIAECLEMPIKFGKMLLSHSIKLDRDEALQLARELKSIVGSMSPYPSPSPSPLPIPSTTPSLDDKKKKKKKKKKKVKVKEDKHESDEQRMVTFLLKMKDIELKVRKQLLFLSQNEVRGYNDFAKALGDCLRKKKLRKFHHVMENIWMACGWISEYDKNEKKVAPKVEYCAALEHLQADARELERLPILGWESGCMPFQSGAPTSSKSAQTESQNGRLWTNSRRNLNERPLFNSSRQTYYYYYNGYLHVNLGESFPKYCYGADISYSCLAVCCDSFHHVGYPCQSRTDYCVG